MYELMVSVPMENKTIEEINSAVLAAVGGENPQCVESGAGFGMRDMTFEFASKDETLAVRDRIRSAFPQAEFGIEKMR